MHILGTDDGRKKNKMQHFQMLFSLGRQVCLRLPRMTCVSSPRLQYRGRVTAIICKCALLSCASAEAWRLHEGRVRQDPFRIARVTLHAPAVGLNATTPSNLRTNTNHRHLIIPPTLTLTNFSRYNRIPPLLLKRKTPVL